MKSMGKETPDLLFIMSVDTEEEWDWEGSFPQDKFSIRNTRRLPDFQQFCESNGVRPTYFVDYPVASDPDASSLLKQIAADQRCELGAHLHPWANPPYYGATGEFESHIVNLPIEQTEAKVDTLLDVFAHRLNVRPTAFRSGRWGISGPILELLRKRGFRIDSSMYPCYSNQYFDCQETPLSPYWPDFEAPSQPGHQRDVIEIPVTVGFNRRNQQAGRALYRGITKPALESFRIVGALWHSRILRKLYLSPEVMSGEEMQDLVNVAIKLKLPAIHMFMHSSSLIDHSKGMLSCANAFETVTQNISELLEFAKRRANVQACTISEAAALIQHRTSAREANTPTSALCDLHTAQN
ncbi:MAG: hypothetical protein Cons2KO_30270 [Congregibacter sp.]